MNIFAVHPDPKICAISHCDIHVRKMIIESMQMLYTAHHVLAPNSIEGMKPTHANHPCSVWARQTLGNYVWLYQLASHLCAEYEVRSGKIHACCRHLDILRKPPQALIDAADTTVRLHPLAMPDELKQLRLEGLSTYRIYQLYLRMKFKDWANRPKPLAVKWSVRGAPRWYSCGDSDGK